MKVTLVPFHTPHADSFCHNWAITSSSESGRLRSSLRGAGGGARVGVSERDRLRGWRERLLGDCERGTAGEKAGRPCLGAVEVK
jgi:hypothetical protein